MADVMSITMVEAIETCFVPLAIYNNKQGADATVLKKYNEPSWNNPVVRIVNQEGDNLVARIGGNYEKLAVCQAMIAALEKRESRFRITYPYWKKN
ncbi:MAG: hypothetical protein R2784_16825 [Saprospiraceae bacterium]